MLVPTLLSAGFALTANAFLLPPEAASTFEAAKNNIAPDTIDPLSRSITLDCSDCLYALASQRNGLHEWTNAVKSDLQLKFTSEDNKLKLNGVPFYPITPPFTPAPLAAKQIKKYGEEGGQGYQGDLRLSYSVEFDNEKKSFPAPGQEAILSEITLSIMGLDNEVVHVDDIKIKALSLPDSANAKHELIIVSVDIQPTDSSDAQCDTILCRVVHKFKSAVRKAQAHAKTAAHKVKCFCVKCIHHMRLDSQLPKHHPAHHRPVMPGQAETPTHLPTHHTMRPDQLRTVRPAWFHTFARATKQFFSFVLLPIIVGVGFGIAASAIGMLVGHVIVAIWLRLRRNSSRTVSYERVETEEKEGLPNYEDLDDGQTATDEKV